MDKSDKIVTLKLRMFKEDRDRLEELARIQQKTVNDLVYQLIIGALEGLPNPIHKAKAGLG